MRSTELFCDGCGQAADQEHLARRLKRLENMTRYRPVHVQALILAAASPADERAHLYSAEDGFQGEAAEVMRVLGVETKGRTVSEALTDFQRHGYLLAHVLDCAEAQGTAPSEALQRRMASTLTRIRRSFKPKRIVLIGSELAPLIGKFQSANLAAALILRDGKPFEWRELSDGGLGKELAAPLQPL